LLKKKKFVGAKKQISGREEFHPRYIAGQYSEKFYILMFILSACNAGGYGIQNMLVAVGMDHDWIIKSKLQCNVLGTCEVHLSFVAKKATLWHIGLPGVLRHSVKLGTSTQGYTATKSM
jgi:hypothetical protein